MWDIHGSLAGIAARQHGLITAEQLVGLRVSRTTISRWRQAGLLHRVHRGVYRVGHRAPSTEARYMAAVLACGDGSALSGHASTWLFGLVHRPPAPEVSTTRNREVPGVIVHRARRLESDDITRWRGIPTTTLPRTLIDLARAIALDALSVLCHRAEVVHGLKPQTVLDRTTNPKLRAIFEGDHALLLSRLERAFRKRLEECALPLPVTNRKLAGHYVDCRWPGHRLTVELDSFTYHRSRHAWEDDRQRERDARGRGDEFRRYTWRDVVEDPAFMLADLRVLLAGTLTA